jgi:hypothetical protein
LREGWQGSSIIKDLVPGTRINLVNVDAQNTYLTTVVI